MVEAPRHSSAHVVADASAGGLYRCLDPEGGIGSARVSATVSSLVRQLAHRLGTPDSHAMHVLARALPTELRHFVEVGASFPDPAVAMLTLGRGAEFGDRVIGLLEQLDLAAAGRARLERLQERFGDWMIVRGLAGRELHELALYFRERLPVAEVVELLGELGVHQSERRGYEALAQRLRSDTVGLFGLLLRPGEPPRQTAYLHVHEDPDEVLAGRLMRCFDGDAAWRGWLRAIHGSSGTRAPDVFVSPLLGAGLGREEVRLEYFQMPLALAEAGLAGAGLLTPGTLSPTSLGADFQASATEHLGLSFGATGARWIYYFSHEGRDA